MKHTPGPWKFERMEHFDDLHKLRGTTPEEHEGYFRENDGSWKVLGSDSPVATVTFKGKAKRGEKWNAPDAEGMANAHLIAAAPELLEALMRSNEILERKADADEATGEELAAILSNRAAIAKAEGGGR